MSARSNEPGIILIEGLPGSGKTTTAQFVGKWLSTAGRNTVVYSEGDLNHPVDFESAARLDEGQYRAMVARFPDAATLLERESIRDGPDVLVYYGLLRQKYVDLPTELFASLAGHDVYELDVGLYQRLITARWRNFAAGAANANQATIFECCFLQNPLTMMLARHDAGVGAARNLVLDLANAIAGLRPRLLYLRTPDARANLERVAQSRPPEWLDYVIRYHTQQGYGRARGWQGFDGLVDFYEMRQSVELSLLPELPFPCQVVEPATLHQVQTEVSASLGL